MWLYKIITKIVYAVLVAIAMVEWNNVKDQRNRLFFCLDIDKAYEQENWNFLIRVWNIKHDETLIPPPPPTPPHTHKSIQHIQTISHSNFIHWHVTLMIYCFSIFIKHLASQMKITIHRVSATHLSTRIAQKQKTRGSGGIVSSHYKHEKRV